MDDAAERVVGISAAWIDRGSLAFDRRLCRAI
jgi:hypothetical protein